MKMRIFLLTVASIFAFSIRCSGQNNSEIPIKEQYDNINESIVSKVSIENLVADNNNGNFLGDRVSYFLKSLLAMYNTTGDKAYLLRFISFSYIIQNVRNDMANSTNHPDWGSNVYSDMYQDGLIIMPMAEFYYILNSTNKCNFFRGDKD